MTPEGSSSKTWIIIVVIAIILAATGFWYYRSNQANYAITEQPVSELLESANPNSNPGDTTNGNVNLDGTVNFGTVNDLPSGSSYPDVGK